MRKSYKPPYTEEDVHFSEIFKGTNFVTPDKIEYGETGKFFYELSTGSSPFDGSKLFGVTLCIKITREKSDLGKVFDSFEKAEKFINSLDK